MIRWGACYEKANIVNAIYKLCEIRISTFFNVAAPVWAGGRPKPASSLGLSGFGLPRFLVCVSCGGIGWAL